MGDTPRHEATRSHGRRLATWWILGGVLLATVMAGAFSLRQAERAPRGDLVAVDDAPATDVSVSSATPSPRRSSERPDRSSLRPVTPTGTRAEQRLSPDPLAPAPSTSAAPLPPSPSRTPRPSGSATPTRSGTMPSTPNAAATPSPSSRPSSTPTRTAQPATGDAALEAAVLSLVNVERAAAGCGAVHADRRLTTAARRHSQDMADQGYFSHTSADGRTPWDRMKSAGYTDGSAENIAAGATTAAAVMKMWMDSAGHRANILNCDNHALGTGVGRGGQYGIYWTQDFGRR